MICPLCSSVKVEKWSETIRPPSLYWACTTCKLIWLDLALRPGKTEERARYRTHNNDPQDLKYMTYLSRLALPIVENLPAGARGLDFGCGPVEGMKKLLFPLKFSVESYDPFFFPREELLNIRYDFVLCSEVAEHFFEPDREFARLSQLVKPGGWLGVSSELAPQDRSVFQNWWYRRDPTHVTFYSEATVLWIAKEGGWTLETLKNPIWLLKKN